MKLLRAMSTHRGRSKKGDPKKICYVYEYTFGNNDSVAGLIYAYSEQEARDYLKKNDYLGKHIQDKGESFTAEKLRVLKLLTDIREVS